MDYTTSANHDTALNGQRKHTSATAPTTRVTAQDLNSIIWELMEVIKAGIAAGAYPTALPFNADVPATYNQLKQAIVALSNNAAQGTLGSAYRTTNGKATGLPTNTDLQTWADSLPPSGLYDCYLTAPQNGLPLGWWYIDYKRHDADFGGGDSWHHLEARSFGGAAGHNTAGLIYQNTCSGGVWTGWILSSPKQATDTVDGLVRNASAAQVGAGIDDGALSISPADLYAALDPAGASNPLKNRVTTIGANLTGVVHGVGTYAIINLCGNYPHFPIYGQLLSGSNVGQGVPGTWMVRSECVLTTNGTFSGSAGSGISSASTITINTVSWPGQPAASSASTFSLGVQSVFSILIQRIA
jgi:hypothetical protein